MFTGSTKNTRDTLYAFKTLNGKLKWRASLGDSAVGSIFRLWSVPTVANGKLLLNGVKKIFAYDALTGSKSWEYSTNVADEYHHLKPLTSLDSIVYAITSSGFPIYAINIATGKLFYQIGSGVSDGGNDANPIAAQKLLFNPHYDMFYTVYDALTVNFVWGNNPAPADDAIDAVIFNSDGKVFYSTESGMQQ